MSRGDYLRKRIGELEAMEAQTTEVMAEIREKMAQADARKEQDSAADKFHKWNEIFRGLEKDLDKAKARLTKCGIELKEKRAGLAAEEMKEAEEAARAEAEAAAKREIPDKIMSMSVDELGDLSFEEIARLQEIELAEAGMAPPAKPEEPEEEAPAKKAEPTPEEREKTRRLQEALETLMGEGRDSLTLGQVTLLLGCYAERSKKNGGEDQMLARVRLELTEVVRWCAKVLLTWKKLTPPE